MTIKELLDVVDKPRDIGITIQVCTKSGDWEDFEVLHSDSALISFIEDKKIKCMGVMGEDTLRIDVEWENKSNLALCDSYSKGYCMCQSPELISVDCKGDENKCDYLSP